MKNINFSPFAKQGRHYHKGKVLLWGIFISLTFLVVVLWHRQVDFSQVSPGQLPEKTARLEVQRDEVHGDDNRERIFLEPELEPELESEKDNPLETASRADKESESAEPAEAELAESVSAKYYLKVYSGVIKNDSEKVADGLAQMNYSPLIIREPGFTVMKNVYVTPDLLGFQETVDRLTRDGFSTYLQKDLQNQYNIRAGSCYYMESAKSLLKSLNHKGYYGNIIEQKTAVKFYSVFLGEYPDFESALKEQKQLNAKGWVAAVVRSE